MANAKKKVRTLTVGGFEVRSQINLGQILQMVGMIALVVAMFVRTESRVSSVESVIEEMGQRINRQQSQYDSQLVDARARLGMLEVANARTEQKFENILNVLERIEKRLDQSEQ